MSGEAVHRAVMQRARQRPYQRQRTRGRWYKFDNHGTGKWRGNGAYETGRGQLGQQAVEDVVDAEVRCVVVGLSDARVLAGCFLAGGHVTAAGSGFGFDGISLLLQASAKGVGCFGSLPAIIYL